MEGYFEWEVEEEDDDLDMFVVLMFFELVIEVEIVIEKLGGVVIFKFNWSVFKDMVWIVIIGSMKC